VRKVTGFLRLMRPANIITAIADILAGISIAGHFIGDINAIDVGQVLLLVTATIGLYGGGVVFNDVFDAELDKIERPERPIPSGLINVTSATFFALLLLVAGILAASLVHSNGIFSLSGILAVVTALFAVIYDKWGKHHLLLGPLNMGLCRGLNLLLGMSIIPASLTKYWFLGFVPVIYIGAITMVSRGEVHGGKKNTLYGAMILYLLVIISISLIALSNQSILYAGAFILLLALMIFPPLLRAISNPVGPLIGKAVKAGVIALIIMNAAWSAAFGFTWFALLILSLLPVSLLLAKLFAVT
jgi:4-hydroxybenzoate polyprenyltransferase